MHARACLLACAHRVSCNRVPTAYCQACMWAQSPHRLRRASGCSQQHCAAAAGVGSRAAAASAHLLAPAWHQANRVQPGVPWQSEQHASTAQHPGRSGRRIRTQGQPDAAARRPGQPWGPLKGGSTHVHRTEQQPMAGWRSAACTCSVPTGPTVCFSHVATPVVVPSSSAVPSWEVGDSSVWFRNTQYEAAVQGRAGRRGGHGQACQQAGTARGRQTVCRHSGQGALCCERGGAGAPVEGLQHCAPRTPPPAPLRRPPCYTGVLRLLPVQQLTPPSRQRTCAARCWRRHRRRRQALPARPAGAAVHHKGSA